MTPRSSAIVLLISLGATIGCYSPQIKQGGLLCTDAIGCPDNYRCINGHCYTGDAGRDVPMKPNCMSVTPDASTCSRDLAPGQACNPACQSGCSCGWCAVMNSTATCITGTMPGTKQAGDVCDPSSPTQCAPGLFCRAECGSGHCYKYCETTSDCPVVRNDVHRQRTEGPSNCARSLKPSAMRLRTPDAGRASRASLPAQQPPVTAPGPKRWMQVATSWMSACPATAAQDALRETRAPVA